MELNETARKVLDERRTRLKNELVVIDQQIEHHEFQIERYKEDKRDVEHQIREIEETLEP